MRFSWRWGLSAIVAIAGMFALLLAPIGLGKTHLAKALEDSLHGPLFAAVAVGSLLLLRQILPRLRLSNYALALLIALILGGLGEVAQAFTGSRHAEIQDWFNDGVGALAGLAAFAVFDPALRFSRVAKCFALLFSAAMTLLILKPPVVAAMDARQRQVQLPALLDWHSVSGYRLLTSTEASGMVTGIPKSWQRASAELALYVQPYGSTTAAEDFKSAPESWPGITLEEPWPEWSGYRALILDIVNPNDAVLPLTLRINDRRHSGRVADRFNRILQIGPRQRTEIVIPLDEIARGPKDRVMDMSAVARIVLFQDGRRGAWPFYLCSLRLSP